MFVLLQLHGLCEWNLKVRKLNCNSVFQAEDTAGWLNKIEKKDNNEPFNSLLREFSLQILHEPIIISANGFFTVNLDLLGSVGWTEFQNFHKITF